MPGSKAVLSVQIKHSPAQHQHYSFVQILVTAQGSLLKVTIMFFKLFLKVLLSLFSHSQPVETKFCTIYFNIKKSEFY